MRVPGIVDSIRVQAWQSARPGAPTGAGTVQRGPVPTLPIQTLQTLDRGRFTADGLASLIARMGAGSYPGGAGWFVNERV